MTFTYYEFECPLPVMRAKYDDNSDAYSVVVERCGETLSVEQSEWKYLQPDGEMDSCGELWKVTCANDHTLVVPDHEGNDSFSQIPYDFAAIREALVSMGCTIRVFEA